jgi:hypothetical protein
MQTLGVIDGFDEGADLAEGVLDIGVSFAVDLLGLAISWAEEKAMQMLAIDLGKQSFHVHGVSADGAVVSRRVGRQKLAALVESLDPKVIAWKRARPLIIGRVCLWVRDDRCGLSIRISSSLSCAVLRTMRGRRGDL